MELRIEFSLENIREVILRYNQKFDVGAASKKLSYIVNGRMINIILIF